MKMDGYVAECSIFPCKAVQRLHNFSNSLIRGKRMKAHIGRYHIIVWTYADPEITQVLAFTRKFRESIIVNMER